MMVVYICRAGCDFELHLVTLVVKLGVEDGLCCAGYWRGGECALICRGKWCTGGRFLCHHHYAVPWLAIAHGTRGSCW